MLNPMPERQPRPGDGPDRVYAELRRSIIEQALRPGTRLPEDKLAASFGVSRTIVRAALERLGSEGLIERENNRSARVASIDTVGAADLLQVRQGIEAMVVQRLSGRLTPHHLLELQAHVAREEQASSLNTPEAVRLAGEFHVKLAQATGSALLTRYVSDVVSRSSLILAAHSLPHSSSCAVREHLELIELIRIGNTAAALDEMTRHLQHVTSRAGLTPA
jgi:DNA-binding GntR family transcriptional regulator